jgi:hypothetical protein
VSPSLPRGRRNEIEEAAYSTLIRSGTGRRRNGAPTVDKEFDLMQRLGCEYFLRMGEARGVW